MAATVYLIVNDINKKVYVGTTKRDWNRRLSDHRSRFRRGDRDHKLYQAMNKYGMENFTMFPICSMLNDSWLDLYERYFISFYDSYNHGYNMTPGGHGVSEATREKLSRALKGRKITWGDKIAASRRANPNIPSPKGLVPEGADNPNSVSYVVMFPNGSVDTFKGLRAFCRDYSLSHNLLLSTLPEYKGKRSAQNHHKGFVLLERFNDYPEREYTQASGSGTHPTFVEVDL